MPCSDGGYYNDPSDRDKINQLTRMLCGVMTTLPTAARATVYRTVPDLSEWWHKHQEQDKKRIAQEKAEAQRKKKALSAYNKLTTEERKLLGIRKPN